MHSGTYGTYRPIFASVNWQINDSLLDIDWEFMSKTDSKRRHAEKMRKDLKYNYVQAILIRYRLNKVE